MFDIYAERVIDEDINFIFDLFTNVDGYSSFRGVKSAKLLEPGESEKYGLGALRCIHLGAMKFEERIICFERPYRLDYLIEKSSPLPFKHELGSIRLQEDKGKTRVTWISKGTIDIPMLGALVLDKIFERKGNQSFGSLLKQASQR